MDGMLESLSKCPTSKIDKSSMSRIYGNCVGEMAKQAGKSSNVDASNLDATMQQLSELASEKTSYVAANRPDFEASELKIFAKETNEKVVKRCVLLVPAPAHEFLTFIHHSPKPLHPHPLPLLPPPLSLRAAASRSMT